MEDMSAFEDAHEIGVDLATANLALPSLFLLLHSLFLSLFLLLFKHSSDHSLVLLLFNFLL